MKVLHITTHMNIGGIANYILGLSAAMEKRGINCIVASSGGNLEGELEKNGISHRWINIDTKFEFAPKVISSALRLSGIVKNEGVDIIHAHSRVSQVAAKIVSKITGVPYITTCHGYFKKRMRKIFDTWGIKIIAISDAVKEHLIKDLGVKEDRIELIYSGVDISRFSPGLAPEEILSVKNELGLGKGPIIGTIGRLSPVKGHRFLVEAMRHILSKRPDAEAIIIGDGTEKRCLESMVASFGGQSAVHFISSNLDTRKFLSVMDIFVFPSVKEGLGIALLEALAAGKACVASDVGGIGDIIKDGESGILVPSMSSHAISEAVIKLVDDSALRNNLGAAGRRVARERFSIDMMADKAVGLYQSVIKLNKGL